VVLEADSEKERISLGIKQLEADPWEGIAAK
jgi:ribosomal protein S1